MCVCVDVSICACMYVCALLARTCLYACRYVCMYVCTYACMYAFCIYGQAIKACGCMRVLAGIASVAVGPGAPRLFTMVSLWFVNMPIILNRTFVLPPWTWGSGRPPRINQKFHRACICVCTYVRTYIGMYVCVYIYMYVYVSMYVCM